jgi:hypothetical protein
MTTQPIDQRPSNGTLLRQGDQYIKSDEKANNRYGQNGYSGPSSDLPGKHTSTGFLPKVTLNPDYQKDQDWQTRKVDATPLALAHGMINRSKDGDEAKVPSKVSHPVKRG